MTCNTSFESLEQAAKQTYSKPERLIFMVFFGIASTMFKLSVISHIN